MFNKLGFWQDLMCVIFEVTHVWHHARSRPTGAQLRAFHRPQREKERERGRCHSPQSPQAEEEERLFSLLAQHPPPPPHPPPTPPHTPPPPHTHTHTYLLFQPLPAVKKNEWLTRGIEIKLCQSSINQYRKCKVFPNCCCDSIKLQALCSWPPW